MTRLAGVLPLAALALATACSDTPTGVAHGPPSTPLFDNLQSDGDLMSGNFADITAGGSAVIRYQLWATSGSGDYPNCNVSGAYPATATINAPAGVSVTPASFTVTACRPTSYYATFTSSIAGSYSISHAITGARGTFNASPANFTLRVIAVTPADDTPPVITPTVTGTLGSNGWYTSDVGL